MIVLRPPSASNDIEYKKTNQWRHYLEDSDCFQSICLNIKYVCIFIINKLRFHKNHAIFNESAVGVFQNIVYIVTKHMSVL